MNEYVVTFFDEHEYQHKVTRTGPDRDTVEKEFLSERPEAMVMLVTSRS